MNHSLIHASNSRSVLFASLALLLASPSAFAWKGGGIGNGSDFFDCRPIGKELDLIETYEGRMTGKPPKGFKEPVTYRSVVKTMYERMFAWDESFADFTHAEATRLMEDYEDLLNSPEPLKAKTRHGILKASDGPLEFGENSGRVLSVPKGCIPRRLINQNPNPKPGEARYEIDLMLAREATELNLGLSFWHEPMYGKGIASGHKTAEPTRRLNRYLFSGTRATVESYFSELAALGFPEYVFLNRYVISTKSEAPNAPSWDDEGNFSKIKFSPILVSGIQVSDGVVRSGNSITLSLPQNIRIHAKGLKVGEPFRPVIHTAGEFRVDSIVDDGKNYRWVLSTGPGKGYRTNIITDHAGVIASVDGTTRFHEELDPSTTRALGDYFQCWKERLNFAEATLTDLVEMQNMTDDLAAKLKEEESASTVQGFTDECKYTQRRSKFYPTGKSMREKREAISDTFLSGMNARTPGGVIAQSFFLPDTFCDYTKRAVHAAFGYGAGLGVIRLDCLNTAGGGASYVGPSVSGYVLSAGFVVQANRELIVLDRGRELPKSVNARTSSYAMSMTFGVGGGMLQGKIGKPTRGGLAKAASEFTKAGKRYGKYLNVKDALGLSEDSHASMGNGRFSTYGAGLMSGGQLNGLVRTKHDPADFSIAIQTLLSGTVD